MCHFDKNFRTIICYGSRKDDSDNSAADSYNGEKHSVSHLLFSAFLGVIAVAFCIYIPFGLYLYFTQLLIRWFPDNNTSHAFCRITRIDLGLQTICRTPHAMSAPVQDMCIDHRRSHVFVTQKFLDRADVISILQKMRGKGMAQGMTGRPSAFA
jgi:hypothetical protein